MSVRPLRAATRGSALARWQTDEVARLLGTAVEVVVVETTGDRRTDVAIHEMGGRGVFVKEVQAAVLEGRADIAVHSAKDLQSTPTPGLVIAAVPERGDPRDALVGSTLEGLPVGGRVATGSVRRRAQLAALRPDLTFAGLRGNIDTRLNKAAGFQGIVMAMAALHRLGYEDRATEALSPLLVLPQVGQGALAVECRDSDGDVAERLAVIDHKPSHLAIDAERAFLAELGSGCDLPVGAYYEGGTLTGIIATLDGRIVLRASVEGRDPAVLGRELADRLLVDAGGWALLEDLRGSVA
ncbi:MAG: hydroxymethylbilane synthase [Acidimicrobiaceae bacterium]|nr:hydroxymethylbilane synthase [Acidimicrobiaceae bacterium]